MPMRPGPATFMWNRSRAAADRTRAVTIPERTSQNEDERINVPLSHNGSIPWQILQFKDAVPEQTKTIGQSSQVATQQLTTSNNWATRYCDASVTPCLLCAHPPCRPQWLAKWDA